MSKFKTAESVSPKHPDKICDQISDAILDAHLTEDPDARIAVDVAGGHGKVLVTGEVTSSAVKVDIASIVRRLAGDVELIQSISAQSPEIANGVDNGGAGDQGIMTGYATSETPEYLPLEFVLSQNLNKFLYERWPYDGKTQVTTYGGSIHTVVASFQNSNGLELYEAVRLWLQTQNYTDVLDEVVVHANPAGDWSIGGFDADAGLTGRKLAVDNYGPRIPIGGGAFSGKDASKVDRSAAYMARRIAIDLLRERGANEVFVTLAYAIGFSQPVQAVAQIDGVEVVIDTYDLSPAGMIDALQLKRPQYEEAARYGHFADPSFTWNI